MITKKRYFFLKGLLSPYDDFNDGAWWAACEGACGGYDEFMDYLLATKKYEPENYKEA